MSVVVDPKSPKEKRTLYASVFGGGVFRSTDGGATWEAKNNGLDAEQALPEAGPAPGRHALRCVHRQEEELARRARASSVPPTKARPGPRSPRASPGTGFAISRSRRTTARPSSSPTSRVEPGLHRTTDGGKTWQTIYKNDKENYFFGAFYHPTNKGWIYLTLVEGAVDASLYLSKDDGATWLPFKQAAVREHSAHNL